MQLSSLKVVKKVCTNTQKPQYVSYFLPQHVLVALYSPALSHDIHLDEFPEPLHVGLPPGPGVAVRGHPAHQPRSRGQAEDVLPVRAAAEGAGEGLLVVGGPGGEGLVGAGGGEGSARNRRVFNLSEISECGYFACLVL